MKIHNRTNRHLSTMTLAIACSAGMAVSAIGQSSNSDRDATQKQRQAESRDAKTSANAPTAYNFQRLSALMGSEVITGDGTDVATIDDLILDRGTGEVSHVVTLSNDILGLGGDRVAIPYSNFRFDVSERKLTLDLDAEEIDSFGENIPAGYIRVESGDLNETLGMIKRSSKNNAHTQAAPWQKLMDDAAETIEVSGEVISVDRTSMRHQEMVVLGIKDDSGAVRKVATGPSWYVMDGDEPLRRGTDITATVVPLGVDESYGYAACDIETDDMSLELWTDDWQPAWRISEQAGDRSGMITASHLMGIGVSAHDDTAGEIQDGIIELGSGKLAMLLLDPNENLFGIGDELKCVPWTVSSVGSDRVHIDSTVETLKACKAAPDDLTLISTPVTLQPMYEVFDVYVVDFEPREQTKTKASGSRRDG